VPEAEPATGAAAADGVHPSDMTNGEDTAAVSPAGRKPAVKRARKATAKAAPGPAGLSATEAAVENGMDQTAVLNGGESAASPTDQKPAVKRVRKAKASAKPATTAQDADATLPGETAVMPKVKRSKKTRAPPAAVPDGAHAEPQIGAEAAVDEADEDPASADKKPKAKRRKKAQAADAAVVDDGEDGADDEDDGDEAASAKKPRKKRAPKVTWPPGVASAYFVDLHTQRAACAHPHLLSLCKSAVLSA